MVKDGNSKRKASEEPPSPTATKKASFFDSDSDSHVNNQSPFPNQQVPTVVCENEPALVAETSTNIAVHQENNSVVLFPYDPDITSASALLCRQCRKTTSVATTQLPVSATIEEREGEIEFRVVNNDNKRESLIILTAIVKKPLEVVGGITYRPFKGLQFAEIVFCAISSEQQVRGYGAHLMSHLKDYVKATSDVMHLLTYADNSAIGYFKKQGFTKEITLPRSVWMGRIKDYEGGTIMQCSMLPRVRYLEMGRMLLKQKECVVAKIRAISKSHVIHPPPKQWTSDVTPIDPLSIKAIRASGWSPNMDELARQPRHGPNYKPLLHLLNDLQNHQSSWPFLNPVNKDDVPDYYDVIKEPMDLSAMEAKLLADQYETPEAFIKDAQLIFDNCRKYNIGTTPYTKSANKLERYMWQKLKAVPEWSHLDA
ncbi:histone acetyltransferase NGF-1 [Apiospora kogelbergensis]|uniref:histone acetyltransferase NGF-1 n=1 Tax=Apiospora kogelbergensis TaxID=1337665 RepID=UPI00313283F6